MKNHQDLQPELFNLESVNWLRSIKIALTKNQNPSFYSPHLLIYTRDQRFRPSLSLLKNNLKPSLLIRYQHHWSSRSKTLILGQAIKSHSLLWTTTTWAPHPSILRIFTFSLAPLKLQLPSGYHRKSERESYLLSDKNQKRSRLLSFSILPISSIYTKTLPTPTPTYTHLTLTK